MAEWLAEQSFSRPTALHGIEPRERMVIKDAASRHF